MGTIIDCNWIQYAAFALQVLTLAALGIYVWYTYKISSATNINVEYGTRPVIGVMLEKESEQTHLWLSVHNLSKTDAVGLVVLRIYANKRILSVNDPAYEGEEFWYLPALQEQTGHKEFSGLIKKAEIPMDGSLSLSTEVFVYYKTWSTSKGEIKNAKRYYAPVKRWDYDVRNNKWVPVLTSRENIMHPLPNWAIIEGGDRPCESSAP